MMDWFKQARGRFINMASSNANTDHHASGTNNSNNTSAASTPGGVGGGAAAASNNGMAGSSGSASPTSDRPYIRQRYVRQLLPMAYDLDAIVSLPSPLVDVNEWLASHIIGLFENISLVYDALYESCSCTSMAGPGGWVCTHPAFHGSSSGATCASSSSDVDGVVYSARQYIDWVLSQAHELIATHHVFPTRYRVAFQPDFRNHVVTITRHLLHILVHLYGLHFNEMVRLDLVGHVNTLTKHFFLFNQHFNLVEKRELEVVGDLQTALLMSSPPSPIVQTTNSQSATPPSGDEVDPLVGATATTMEATRCQ